MTNTNRMYRRLVDYHCKKEVIGDGTDRLQLDLPFQPDLLQVICTDPRIMSQNGAVVFFNGDFSGLGFAAAVSSILRDGGIFSFAMTTASIGSRLINGALTNIKDGDSNCVFSEGLCYQVVATKMGDQTFAERLTEFVESLTGTGTAQIYKARVQEAFTQEQWDALKATKPGWTFKEV